jgi:uncharacterized protein YjbI with pentapeptide repeats
VEQQQTPRERAHDLIHLLVPDWHPTTSQLLWVIRITIVSVLFLSIFELVGDYYSKTLWEVADLLIVPAAIAGGVAWFNHRQQNLQNEIENRRAEQDVLRSYLDLMGTMLTEQGLHKEPENSDARRLARARTLTTLDALGPERQRRVLRFLYETELIQTPQLHGSPVISLKFAIMEGIDLHRRRLLQGADLTQSNMTDADLAGANLTGTQLRGAKLTGANLTGAKLTGAKLTDADLTRADLGGAEGITHEDLERQAKSLKGATMPDGTVHS